MKNNTLPIEYLLIGYLNNFIDYRTLLELCLLKLQSNPSDEILVVIVGITNENLFKEEYLNKIFYKVFKVDISENKDHFLKYYYNYLPDKLAKVILRYWRYKILKDHALSSDINLVERFVKLKEEFSFPSDMPKTIFNYDFEIHNDWNDKDYLEKINSDAEVIRRYIDDEKSHYESKF